MHKMPSESSCLSCSNTETAMTSSSSNTYSLPLNGRPLIATRFISRPNRFLVTCEDEHGGCVKAFLPNPGRLHELLLPDVKLYLLHDADTAGNRATEYTVLAVERDQRPLLLHTHWCNIMARQLLDAGVVPGLKQMRVVRSEVTVGHSRFDFLLEDASGLCYVEVKSCTLFGNGVAMFPDAVTARGRRHLHELAAIAASGAARCRVLFIVQTDCARTFMPDYHTDPAFADTILDVHERVPIIPLPITWDSSLHFRVAGQPLPIPWAYVAEENRDRGTYLLLLRLRESHELTIGNLGTLPFASGWYLYVGSAMKGLDARIARHKRTRKTKHWHIDYLRDAAEVADCLPIRASQRLECDIAHMIAASASSAVRGFGCSDCECPSHLFYFHENPLHQGTFHAILQHFRMRHPHE